MQEAGQNGWLGGADITDAQFRWMDGPEAGTRFWTGNKGGGAFGSAYANWGVGEPNDYEWPTPTWFNLFSKSSESYVMMVRSSSFVIGGWTRNTAPGKWNDAPLKTSTSSSYALGYLVEYGPSATEPLLFAKTRTLRPLPLTWRLNGGGVAITGYSGGGGELVIPATLNGLTVNRIDPEAFKDQTTLTQITLPAGVTTIGSYAFANCSNLRSIYFEGDAPVLETGSGHPFAFVSATLYYRSTAVGWGASFGGLTTVAYTSPGHSPGKWDFASGNYGHGMVDGMLLLELGGLEGTTLYDQIFVRNGAATLDGVVNLMFYGSYTGPVSGAWHTFDLLWAQNGITLGNNFRLVFDEPGFAVDTALVQKDGGQLWQATVRQAAGPEEIAVAGELAQPFLGTITSPGPGGAVELLYTYTRLSGGSYLNGRYAVGAVQYEVQMSSDLRTWSAAMVEEISVIPTGSGYETATVRVVSGTAKAFLRLKVSN